jgi:steroid 5-alpha reductase family enzyme
MPVVEILATNVLVIGAMMLLIWLISVYLEDVSIVVIFWGVGFVLIAWMTLTFGGMASPRSYLLAAMVSVWGIRLSSYLAWRNWGKPEDYRYAAMRERHGRRFPLVSLLTVFALQGTIMWIVSLPIQVYFAKATPVCLPVWIGISLFSFGLFFETVGDYQLTRFKAMPANRGHVMSQGLWRYTRHPNYFGDFLVWWGLYLAAADSESWWWTVTGPLLMSWLLVRISGVRLLETSLRVRVAGYEAYVANTSPFFPLPPKN